jgi:IS30 family transposase
MTRWHKERDKRMTRGKKTELDEWVKEGLSYGHDAQQMFLYVSDSARSNNTKPKISLRTIYRRIEALKAQENEQ